MRISAPGVLFTTHMIKFSTKPYAASLRHLVVNLEVAREAFARLEQYGFVSKLCQSLYMSPGTVEALCDDALPSIRMAEVVGMDEEHTQQLREQRNELVDTMASIKTHFIAIHQAVALGMEEKLAEIDASFVYYMLAYMNILYENATTDTQRDLISLAETEWEELFTKLMNILEKGCPTNLA